MHGFMTYLFFIMKYKDFKGKFLCVKCVFRRIGVLVFCAARVSFWNLINCLRFRCHWNPFQLGLTTTVLKKKKDFWDVESERSVATNSCKVCKQHYSAFCRFLFSSNRGSSIYCRWVIFFFFLRDGSFVADVLFRKNLCKLHTGKQLTAELVAK